MRRAVRAVRGDVQRGERRPAPRARAGRPGRDGQGQFVGQPVQREHLVQCSEQLAAQRMVAPFHIRQRVVQGRKDDGVLFAVLVQMRVA